MAPAKAPKGLGDRKMPRLEKNLGLQVLLPDGWSGDVVDLSLTGMRIHCLVELPVTDAVVQASLKLPSGKSIAFKARVVWSNPPDHRAFIPAEIGMELAEISDEYTKTLAELFAVES